MKFTDYNGNFYTKKTLLERAEKEWQKLSWQGDYYFLQGFKRKEITKSADAALKFLNNYYETATRDVSFWRVK